MKLVFSKKYGILPFWVKSLYTVYIYIWVYNPYKPPVLSHGSSHPFLLQGQVPRTMEPSRAPEKLKVSWDLPIKMVIFHSYVSLPEGIADLLNIWGTFKSCKSLGKSLDHGLVLKAMVTWGLPFLGNIQMGVSINGGPPRTGCFTMENPIGMDDDWGYPHFRKPPYTSLGLFAYNCL